MSNANRIGFMQGRFSPQVNGQIQAFPWECWQREFSLGHENGFRVLEWTLDQRRLYENPLLTASGQSEITALGRTHSIAISSLTGDCFMQAPFWKADSQDIEQLIEDFRAVARACSAVGIAMIVIPLVDNGRLSNRAEEDTLIGVLKDNSELLRDLGVKSVFESDFGPLELSRFIDRLDDSLFGINYDIGNSAGLGMLPSEEIHAYGHRIANVHVKDRVFGGSTVPLGAGNADFDAVFEALARVGYKGNYILQTARADNGDHSGVLCHYRDMVVNWLGRHGA